MKKSIAKIVLIFIFFISNYKIHSQESNIKYEIKQIIPCIYDEGFEFQDGLGRVKLNGEWGFIDKTGKFVIKYGQDEYEREFPPFSNFSEGLAIVRYGHYNNESFFFINKTGEIVSPKFQYASVYNEGLACVKTENWEGLIDKNGRKIFNCKCKNSKFSFGLLQVETIDNNGNSNYVFLDKKLNQILTIPITNSDYDDSLILENIIFISTGKTTMKIIDLNGNDLLPINKFIAEDYKNDMLLLKANFNDNINYYYNYYNIETKKLIEVKFKEAKIFSEDLAAVKIQEKWGFIDRNGKLVIQPIYDEAYFFNEGLCAVEINGKYGFIDKSGKIVINPKFSDVFGIYDLLRWGTIKNGFDEGLIRVALNGKMGIINTSGKNITEFKYESISKFSNGIASARIDGKFGLIDKFGNEISTFIYEDISDFHEGIVRVKLNGKYGYISLNKY